MIYQQQVFLEQGTYDFYDRIARSTGLSIQQVLSDALFRLAGELSLEAIDKTKRSEIIEKARGG